MAILVDSNTRVVIQGITGGEGSRAAHDMIAYGTQVVAGVTPGKGGQTTPDGVPVYDTVSEALEKHPEINFSFIAVPAPFVLDAALEAVHAGIATIDILTEKVPVHDVASILAYARTLSLSKGAIRIIGPSSVGIISPSLGKVGSVGSGDVADRVFRPGSIGVISKSGGMTAEVSRILTDAGLGQSTAVGIGGDVLIGSDFVDLALLFEADPATHAIVIFGEVGGVYEEKLADAIANGRITKPVVALIAGDFGAKLPQDTVLGHAGAIVSAGRGSAKSKIAALKKAGARVARTPEEIPTLVKQAIKIKV